MKKTKRITAITFVLSVSILILNIQQVKALSPSDTTMTATGIDPAKLPPDDSCINCHIQEEIMPQDFRIYDIHMQSGLSCAGCHGGDNSKEDESEAMDEDKGFTGVPDKRDIPAMCGKCHSEITFMRAYQPRIATDQEAQYFSSVHGQKLKSGDDKVATCINCHSAHKIISAKDPRSTVYPVNVPSTCEKCHGNKEYMSPYNIETNQFSEYVQSVHGVALLEKEDTGSPACNDCHGNHGATPPGVSSVSHVCGTCHAQNLEFFSQSKMYDVFATEKKHGCEECHGKHLILKPFDEMVGISEKSICIDCHDDDAGYYAADTISILLSQAVSSYDTALVKQKEVQIIGMDDLEIGYLLKEARQGLIHARTTVHSFEPAKVKEKTEESLKNSKDAIILGIKEIDDYGQRRLGLGIATVFITLLVVSLIFKIREMEKEKSAQP